MTQIVIFLLLIVCLQQQQQQQQKVLFARERRRRRHQCGRRLAEHGPADGTRPGRHCARLLHRLPADQSAPIALRRHPFHFVSCLLRCIRKRITRLICEQKQTTTTTTTKIGKRGHLLLH